MGKGISLRLTQEEGGGDGWGSPGSQALRGQEQGFGDVPPQPRQTDSKLRGGQKKATTVPTPPVGHSSPSSGQTPDTKHLFRSRSREACPQPCAGQVLNPPGLNFHTCVIG